MHPAEAAVALAGQLRSLTDQELAELLRERAVPLAGIADFLDLAEALTAADSVQAALTRLDRGTLATLAVLGEAGAASADALRARLTALGAEASRMPQQLDVARRLGLVAERDGVYAVPRAVAGALAGWPERGLPGLPGLLAAAPGGPEPLGNGDPARRDATAAEIAFATTGHIAELVLELESSPARRLSRGGIALPDARRLAEATSVPQSQLALLLRCAERARLLQESAGLVQAAEHAHPWLSTAPAERWGILAGAWLAGLPRQLQEVLAARSALPWGQRLGETVSWLFPADPGIRERAERAATEAEALGIVVDGLPSGPGSALLRGEHGTAVATLHRLLPAAVDKVYLQHDLSIVAPGPLRSDLDLRLRGMAEVEGRSLAVSYRMSAASLARALTEGQTADSIRDFLGGISLTGLPQPLEYLIAEAAERHGLVRVRGTADSTIVSSPDAALLRTIAVDSALSALLLLEDEGRLFSRFDAETVYWALAEAKYPAALEDEHGELLPPPRHRLAAAFRPAQQPDAIAELIERLRVTEPVDAEAARAAWLNRQLEAAARSRQTVLVTVRLPDGSTEQFLLEPSSVAGGRLRGRDRERELERTLPLSSIEGVEVADPAD